MKHARDTLREATERLSPKTEEKRSKTSGRSVVGISDRPTVMSRASSGSAARIQALAEAAAAKREAEYDLLMADMENERRQVEAQEEMDRAAAKAQHDRNMAVLAAKKLTAVAEAKLHAIEQSIF